MEDFTENLRQIILFISMMEFDSPLDNTDPDGFNMADAFLQYQMLTRMPDFKNNTFVIWLSKIDLFKEKFESESTHKRPAWYEGDRELNTFEDGIKMVEEMLERITPKDMKDSFTIIRVNLKDKTSLRSAWVKTCGFQMEKMMRDLQLHAPEA